jgi:hypothetical protein
VAKRDYGGDLFDLEDVPPILDVETWERVGARLAEPKPHSGASRTHRLLSGIAQCGRCLVPLRGGTKCRAAAGSTSTPARPRVDLAHALKPPPGQPKMPLKLYWQMVAEVEAEREELQRCLAVTREASLLLATLSFEDMASEWAQRPNGWRRAILKLCTKRILVEPVGKLAGVTPKGFRFDPERVRIEFVVWSLRSSV